MFSMFRTILIHHNGVYNLFSLILDRPMQEVGQTQEQARVIIEREQGYSFKASLKVNDWASCLERTHTHGTSYWFPFTLQQCIDSNRAGPNETKMSSADFITKY
jgi:hypothetical protein